jgi:hypothetical protein
MDKITRKKLKLLVEQPEWDVVYVVFEEVIRKWNNVPVKGETEWETLWNVAEKEGKKDGLREFINSLEEIAHEN